VDFTLSTLRRMLALLHIGPQRGIVVSTGSDLPDHAHSAGDGGNLPAYVHLAGAETIAGLKTLTGEATTESFLHINDSGGLPAAWLIVRPNAGAGGGIVLPKADNAEHTWLLGVISELPPGAGDVLLGSSLADGHVEPLAIGTAAQVLTVNPAGTLPEWAAPEDVGIATEEYVNAAVAQVISLASGGSVTVGHTESGDYASTNVHDGTPWQIHEAGTGQGITAELTFSGIAAGPTALWLRVRYAGHAEHHVHVSIWNYVTASAEVYQELTNSAGYSFYSIPIPDGADHISGGAAKVQFQHVGEGSADDYLYIDYCALVKTGLGSETIDAARTWETEQTFVLAKFNTLEGVIGEGGVDPVVIFNLFDTITANCVFGKIVDTTTGHLLELSAPPLVDELSSVVFPTGGTIMSTSSTQFVSNKTFTSSTTINAAGSNYINCNTTGPRFRNGTSTTQYMLLDLSLLTAARTVAITNHSQTLASDVNVIVDADSGNVLTYNGELLLALGG
jgi:hypothetical protein